MTLAVLVHYLVRHYTPDIPQATSPAPVITSVYSAGDHNRERRVLADLADLTAVTDPWTVATTLFGGTP